MYDYKLYKYIFNIEYLAKYFICLRNINNSQEI